jgi:hypothetical protein
MLVHSPGSLPVLRVNSQNRSRPGCQIDEAAVMVDFSIAKQPGQQSQGVLGEDLVHERFLSLQELHRAAARPE